MLTQVYTFDSKNNKIESLKTNKDDQDQKLIMSERVNELEAFHISNEIESQTLQSQKQCINQKLKVNCKQSSRKVKITDMKNSDQKLSNNNNTITKLQNQTQIQQKMRILNKLDSFKNIFQDYLFQRKLWRIFLLFALILIVLILIIIYYYTLGFIRGSIKLHTNQKVLINLESCTLMIYDYDLINTSNIDINFLSGTLNIPADLNENESAYLQYIYPQSPLLGIDSSFNYDNKQEETNFSFNNKLNSYECEVAIIVYKAFELKSLIVDCGNTQQCNVVIYSNLFSANILQLKGVNIQMNAPLIKADTFSYESMQGSVEIPYLLFKTASIITREGDISIQSPNDIDLTFYQKDPFNCISSKSIINPATGQAFLSLNEFQKSIQLESNLSSCKKGKNIATKTVKNQKSLYFQ
ncbi:hypothetical protein ABPG73_017967 [Tetrahymena malaccensis]